MTGKFDICIQFPTEAIPVGLFSRQFFSSGSFKLFSRTFNDEDNSPFRQD